MKTVSDRPYISHTHAVVGQQHQIGSVLKDGGNVVFVQLDRRGIDEMCVTHVATLCCYNQNLTMILLFGVICSISVI